MSRGSLPAPPASHRVVLAAFAISGAAALALEVVWTRWMVLAVGASSFAVALVLSVFMAGLGAGALAAGRVADRKAGSVLGLFAAAEGGVALWAFVSIPLAGSWLPELSAALARAFGASTLPMAVRAVLSILVLIPPTFLMGASLPLLARWSASAGLLPGRGVAALYTANILGGVAGTLLAVAVLVDRLGLGGTVAVAGVADGCVAVGAFLLFRRESRDARPPAVAPARRTSEPLDPGARARGAMAAAAIGYFTSGFVGLGLEVVSHRVISALVESSVYAFGVMLAAFLLGIAAGSFAGGRMADRTEAPVAWLGVALGGVTLGIGVAKAVFQHWRLSGSSFSVWFLASPWSYALELAGCLAALLPATIMLGAAVPLVARVTAGSPARMASRFGAAYALNTGGAVAGAGLAGFVLAPHLGTAISLDVLALFAGVVGIALAVVGRRARLAAATAGLVAVGLALGWGADPVRRALGSWSPTGTLVEFREGPVQAVAVVAESNDLQLDFLRIVADRTSFAATNLRSRRYMGLLGHLPALWGRPPESALVICFGTGVTAAAVASHPGIARVDVAEISPEVLSLAPRFAAWNGGVLSNSRVRLHVEDGRHLALAAREPWDLITLEPPPPRDSGVVSLYSADFYRLCRRRLRPGGVTAQWCPLESQSQEEVRTIVRTFVEAFPYVLAFLPVEHDLILLGSDRPLVVDPAEVTRRMAAVAVRRSLAEVGFGEPADLLATVVADRDALGRFAGELPVVTDDRPRLEYFARFGRRVFRPDPAALLVAVPPIETLVSTPPSPALRERFARSREAILASWRSGWARAARSGEDWMSMAARAAAIRPDDPFYLWAASISDEHLARLEALAVRSGNDARIWRLLGLREAQRGRPAHAIRALERALELAPGDTAARSALDALRARQGP